MKCSKCDKDRKLCPSHQKQKDDEKFLDILQLRMLKKDKEDLQKWAPLGIIDTEKKIDKNIKTLEKKLRLPRSSEPEPHYREYTESDLNGRTCRFYRPEWEMRGENKPKRVRNTSTKISCGYTIDNTQRSAPMTFRPMDEDELDQLNKRHRK